MVIFGATLDYVFLRESPQHRQKTSVSLRVCFLFIVNLAKSTLDFTKCTIEKLSPDQIQYKTSKTSIHLWQGEKFELQTCVGFTLWHCFEVSNFYAEWPKWPCLTTIFFLVETRRSLIPWSSGAWFTYCPNHLLLQQMIRVFVVTSKVLDICGSYQQREFFKV